jgi:transposase
MSAATWGVPMAKAQRGKPTAAARNAEILRLYGAEGLDGIAVANRLGIGRSTVYRVLRAAQATRPRGRQPWQPKRGQLTEAKRLYKSGWSLNRIAAHLGGVTGTTVAKYLRQEGVGIRRRGVPRKQ